MRSLFNALSRGRRAPASAPADPTELPREPHEWRERILDLGLTPERALHLAAALEREGRLLPAIEALTAANRMRRDAAVERRLVRLRHAAFAQLDRSLPPPPWPPLVPDDPPGTPPGPLIVTPAELDAGVMRRGLLRHGCILVRGLVPPARARRLRTAVERAFGACAAVMDGAPSSDTAPWYDPLENLPGGDELRFFGRAAQSVLAADSPRTLFEFLETVYESGLDRLIAAYLGERPTLDIKKCVLRQVDWTCQHSIWHQDGAFLGHGIRTVNAWFALTDCGRDAPGMDLMPLRLDGLVTPGEPGAGFDWAVSADTIARELPGVAPWRPEIGAGDVLLFDHFMLHRTAAAPGMRELRYAIESWFFASSVYPTETSAPLVV
ncbi:MAG: phytanoyl-CoA dioxygenase family protein [Deltaproteobacteria bacterium]|nr:phytanoyl-CoA dioxygenase family protein [Deltaproteobacteria bacterium]